jgi:hypothetical protein
MVLSITHWAVSIGRGQKRIIINKI